MSRLLKPYLPPLDEYVPYLQEVWNNNWVTNDGPQLKSLEQEVPSFLNSIPMLAVTNGTMALQMALKSFDVKGTVLTTPFSFIATSSAAVWEGFKIQYADIDPETWNIDPYKLEEAITADTCIILATHVYGNPCDVGKIEAIAKRHNLFVVYDGAHGFNIKYQGKSLFDYGDASICSFHATKIFHSFEGGAVFTQNETVKERIIRFRNFGFKGAYKHVDVGVNGKMSEVHAAMGRLNLKYITAYIRERITIFERYSEIVMSQPDCKLQNWKGDNINGAYFPVLLANETKVLELDLFLKEHGYEGRRYFYPSLNEIFEDNKSLPIAEDISRRVFCLPLLPLKEMEPLYKILTSKCWS